MIPYLHFAGTCEAAMTFYAKVFAAPAPELNRYADMPGMDLPPGAENLVMHAQIETEHGTLMASDAPPGEPAEPQASVSVTIMAADAETGKRIFDALAEGGAASVPFAPTFFSTGFGMLRDRFGTHWMIMGPQTAPE